MTLSQKDTQLLGELDSLNVSVTIAAQAVADAQLVSDRLRAIVNAIVTPPIVPPPIVLVPPDAGFTFTPTVTTPRQFTFSGFLVALPLVVSYSWDWGDGTSESHAYSSAKKTYLVDGTYKVTLTVTEMNTALALKASRTQTIIVTTGIVTPPPPPPPPIVIPPSTTIPAAGENWAKSPQIFIDSKLPSVTGKTISVAAGGDLQAAMGLAKAGDAIELDNNGTWIGNFQAPPSAGGWVQVRAAQVRNAPGTRVTSAAGLPRILSPNNMGALTASAGAGQMRFINLEIASDPKISNTGLVRFGTGMESKLSDLPHDFVLDRCYAHGSPLGNLRRAVILNCVAGSVIDSYLSDCHEKGADSQALGGWNGAGPFLIEGNYLEAASENVMFGGSDPLIAGLIPSDIVIRRNHITKQMVWLGQGWVIKNLFELKNACRVLVEANVMENNWRDGQGGSAVNLKSVNQSGSAPWSQAKDITMRLNLIRNVGSGFNLTGTDPGVALPAERLTLHDNVIYGINLGQFLGDGRGAMVNNNPVDLTLAHNTILNPDNMAIAFGGPAQTPPLRFVFRDSVIGGGQYGVKGPSMNVADSFAAYMATGKFLGNVVVTSDPTGYPAGNFFAPSVAALQLDKDLRLGAFKNKATDGHDSGANIDALLAAIAGVVLT